MFPIFLYKYKDLINYKYWNSICSKETLLIKYKSIVTVLPAE